MCDLFNKIVNRKNTNTYKWDYQTDNENLPFWIADSDYMTLPSVIDELNNIATCGVYGYNFIPAEFKKQVVSWYYKRYQSKVLEEWVVPSTGVILEIRIILDILTKEKDTVILQTPVYHTFHQLINKMNRTIVENKLKRVNDTYEIDFENLEQLFANGNKVLILCSPHNPIGRIWNYDEIEKIMILAKKYKAFVIVDEIHSDLNISGKKFTSGVDFVSLYNNLVVCNAPSKAFNLAGLHTSYIIIPQKDLRNKFEQVVDRECLNEPSVFGYTALIEAYRNGDKWIDQQNVHLHNNYLYLKDYLNKELPDALVTKLEGTYLVWIDLSFTNLNTQAILQRCDEFKITVSGGVNFGKDYESYLRFNIACGKKQLEEGLKRLVNAFKN